MHKERHKSFRVRPRLIDKMQLAMSTAQYVDGIWVGSWRTPEDLPRVEHAMLLIKQHSPLHYSRIVNNLERIWIFLLLHDGLAEYDRSLKACVLDERYIADPATSVERIASTIVHEATHAKLERCGVEYKEDQRARIESVCFRREQAFAARLPDSAKLKQNVAEYLKWYPANPDYFSNAQSIERHRKGEIEALRYVGVPDLLIRIMSILRSMIEWIRRLFRIA